MDLLERLLAVEARRRDAWLRRDRRALADVLDEDFVEINSFGRLTKRQLLDDLFDRLILKEFLIEAPRLHRAGASPILSYACFERLDVDARAISGRFHVASHYTRRGAAWKILLWQITPAAETAS